MKKRVLESLNVVNLTNKGFGTCFFFFFVCVRLYYHSTFIWLSPLRVERKHDFFLNHGRLQIGMSSLWELEQKNENSMFETHNRKMKIQETKKLTRFT